MRPLYMDIVAAGIVLAGCTVGPNYSRPQVQTPANFRAPAPLPPESASLADGFEVFHDEELQELIRVALKQNYDLRDAVARVEEARANLGRTRSNQIPQVGASGDLAVKRLSRGGQSPLPRAFVQHQNRSRGSAARNL